MHAVHAAPAVPQDVPDCLSYAWHAPAAVQQPSGQDFESQTQCPVPLHSCPEAHAAHVVPPVPQDVVDSAVSASQLSSEVQQPGHEVPAQLQAPSEHPSPERHAPQAAPPLPHSEPDCAEVATHSPAAVQQPLGHEVALHVQAPVVVSHAWPEPQAAHAAPIVPHSVADSEAAATQTPTSLQHPMGHDRALQVPVTITSVGVAWSATYRSRPTS